MNVEQRKSKKRRNKKKEKININTIKSRKRQTRTEIYTHKQIYHHINKRFTEYLVSWRLRVRRSIVYGIFSVVCFFCFTLMPLRPFRSPINKHTGKFHGFLSHRNGKKIFHLMSNFDGIELLCAIYAFLRGHHGWVKTHSVRIKPRCLLKKSIQRLVANIRWAYFSVCNPTAWFDIRKSGILLRM